MRLVVWSNGVIYTLLYMYSAKRGDGQEKNNYYITNNKLTLMKMEKEMKYVAPEVEVLEVEIEKGFAGSGGNTGGDFGGGDIIENPEV